MEEKIQQIENLTKTKKDMLMKLKNELGMLEFLNSTKAKILQTEIATLLTVLNILRK